MQSERNLKSQNRPLKIHYMTTGDQNVLQGSKFERTMSLHGFENELKIALYFFFL